MIAVNQTASPEISLTSGLLGGVRAARELRRLKKSPRYVPFTTSVLGQPIQGVDGPSFYYSFREIFNEQIYSFRTESKTPRIIDGGSNVGLSILYFKKHYPQARITGFEPDPQIFAVLQRNLDAFELHDVELVQKAIWTEETQLRFHHEGADGGHLVDGQPDQTSISVDACAMRTYLQEPVDLLKLDIEGAEVDVIVDCRAELENVQNLFVEYHSFADRPQRLSEMTAALTDAGFRYQIQTQYASKQPLLTREHQLGMDLQLNVFAYRV